MRPINHHAVVLGASMAGLTAARVLADAYERVTVEELVRADLVVDATGRGSRGPAWLEELGYQRPVEEQVHVGIIYTTRVFRRRPEHLGGDIGAVVGPTPELRRGGGILAMEGDRWIVTLFGYFGEQAPADPEGFAAFAATLAAPDISEVVRDAEPLEDARVTRYPASMRRRYGRLDRFPDEFLVVGDAECGFSPIYGQGMTVAAREALALRDCLRQGPTDRRWGGPSCGWSTSSTRPSACCVPPPPSASSAASGGSGRQVPEPPAGRSAGRELHHRQDVPWGSLNQAPRSSPSSAMPSTVVSPGRSCL